MVFMLISSKFFLLKIVLFKAYYLIPDHVKNAYQNISLYGKNAYHAIFIVFFFGL